MLKRFWNDERGASAAEYALILAVVGPGIGAAALVLGANVKHSGSTFESDLEATNAVVPANSGGGGGGSSNSNNSGSTTNTGGTTTTDGTTTTGGANTGGTTTTGPGKSGGNGKSGGK